MSRMLSAVDVATSTCIAMAAAFEAMIEVQRWLPDADKRIVSSMGWPNFVPLGLVMLVGCLWIARLFLSAKRTIQILAPLEDSIVPPVREVRGSIWPADEPVQIFVHTGQEWHPQQLPTRDGAFWAVQCRFETSAAGSEPHFKIAAISRATLLVGPVKRLPWWSTTRSPIVRVMRREQ